MSQPRCFSCKRYFSPITRRQLFCLRTKCRKASREYTGKRYYKNNHTEITIEKTCPYCHEKFKLTGSRHNKVVCNKKSCRLAYMRDRQQKMVLYRERYSKTERGVISNSNLGKRRRSRRRYISSVWGNNGRKIWKKSERYKLVSSILRREGFSKIINLNNLYPASPFDYTAEKDNKKYVFQVTVRTHSTKSRQGKLAQLLDLRFLTLFITQDLQYYITRIRHLRYGKG